MDKRSDTKDDVKVDWKSMTTEAIGREIGLGFEELEMREEALRKAKSVRAKPNESASEEKQSRGRGRPRKASIVDAEDLELVEDEDGFNGTGAPELR